MTHILSRTVWIVARWCVLPDFHHPLRAALRRAGIERHASLAKW